MTGAATILLGDARGAWATVFLWSLAALFMLLLAALALGLRLSRRSPWRPRSLWLVVAAALAAAAVAAGEGSRPLTRVARIEIDGTGAWGLRSACGRRIARVAPGTRRSLTLWAEVRSRETAPYFDDLRGRLKVAGGREYDLQASQAFDLLIRLGYGRFWLDHENPGGAEEAAARQLGARMVFAGSSRSGALVLPLHAYDLRGIAVVGAFLAGRADGPL